MYLIFSLNFFNIPRSHGSFASFFKLPQNSKKLSNILIKINLYIRGSAQLNLSYTTVNYNYLWEVKLNVAYRKTFIFHFFCSILLNSFCYIHRLFLYFKNINIQKTKIMTSGPITSLQIDGENVKTVQDFISLGSKITVDSDCSHEIKTSAPWKKSYDKPRQHIKKQRHHFVDKGLLTQSYGFSSSRVQM